MLKPEVEFARKIIGKYLNTFSKKLLLFKDDSIIYIFDELTRDLKHKLKIIDQVSKLKYVTTEFDIEKLKIYPFESYRMLNEEMDSDAKKFVSWMIVNFNKKQVNSIDEMLVELDILRRNINYQHLCYDKYDWIKFKLNLNKIKK
jgi:hypothetical protein